MTIDQVIKYLQTLPKDLEVWHEDEERGAHHLIQEGNLSELCKVKIIAFDTTHGDSYGAWMAPTGDQTRRTQRVISIT